MRDIFIKIFLLLQTLSQQGRRICAGICPCCTAGPSDLAWGVCIKDSASHHIIWIRKYRWKVIQLSLARFCAWSLCRLFLTTALKWECGILFEEKILRAFCKQQILLSLLLQCLSSKKGLGKPSGKLLYSDFCLWDAQQVNCAKAPSSGPVQWWEKADSLATHKLWHIWVCTRIRK